MLAGPVLAPGQGQLHLGQPVEQRPFGAARQHPPRGVQGFRRPGDHLQERRTVAFQLFRPHSGDPGHLVQRRGLLLGHLDQRAVCKDDIGRDILRLGQRPAARLQCRQEARVLIRHLHPHGVTVARGVHGVLSQGHRRLAPQDGARGIGHPQGAVPVGVGAHQIAAQHLAKHRPPGGFRQVAAHGKGGKLVVPAFAHLGRGVAG